MTGAGGLSSNFQPVTENPSKLSLSRSVAGPAVQNRECQMVVDWQIVLARRRRSASYYKRFAPMAFEVRIRLKARAKSAASAFTRRNPRVRKRPLPVIRLIDPKGYSTVQQRTVIRSGFSWTRRASSRVAVVHKSADRVLVSRLALSVDLASLTGRCPMPNGAVAGELALRVHDGSSRAACGVHLFVINSLYRPEVFCAHGPICSGGHANVVLFATGNFLHVRVPSIGQNVQFASFKNLFRAIAIG